MKCFLPDLIRYTLYPMFEMRTIACLGVMSILVSGCAEEPDPPEDSAPVAGLELAQPDLFDVGGAYTNAWADFDNDGDLDLFVGFG